MKKRWHITYNAPVTLTFALFCALVLLTDSLLQHQLIPALFTAPGAPFDYHSPLNFLRLLTHVFGHADWNHLLGNLAFILLLGPLMEERYGSPMLALMMTATALVTGVINACLIPAGLLGASGIVFMLIVLASLSTIEKGEIPISFIFIIAIYLGRELGGGAKAANVATVAHIVGGLCGSLFGFMNAPKKRAAKKFGDEKTATGAKTTHSADEAKPQTNYEKLRERLRERQEQLRQQHGNAARPARPAPSSADSETTVLGTLSL